MTKVHKPLLAYWVILLAFVQILTFAACAQNISLPSESNWATSGSNVYRPSGNVGIGTATPAAKLTVGGQSLTGSEATSLLDLASTWNTTGTPTALKLDVTDTASNASSLLMDLQVGGASKFKVDKGGALVSSKVTANPVAGGDYSFVTGPAVAGQAGGLFLGSGVLKGSGYNYITLDTGWGDLEITSWGGLWSFAGAGLSGVTSTKSIYINSDQHLGFSSSAAVTSAADTRLYRDAAGILAQRNTTNTQESRIYNTYTDASNGEWLELGFQDTTNTAVIKTNANGTGTVRDIVINGVTLASSGSVISAGGAAILSDSQTGTGGSGYLYWQSRSSMQSPVDGVIQLQNVANTDFNRLQFGGATSAFPSIKRSGAGLQARLADDSANTAIEASYVKSGTYTVATLPAAATVGAGATAFVSDGSVVHAGNSDTVVAGSGANFVPVYSDGTNWRIQ